MKSNHYITVQASEPNKPSTFVINGEISLFCSNPLQIKVAEKLADAANWNDVPFAYMFNKSELPKWFHMKHKDGQGYYITSCFQDEDQLGKKVGFQFLSESEDINYIIEHLKEDAEKASRKINDNELKALEKIYFEYHKKKATYKTFKKNAKKFALGAAITVAAVIIGKTAYDSCNKSKKNKKTEIVDSHKINATSVTK